MGGGRLLPPKQNGFHRVPRKNCIKKCHKFSSFSAPPPQDIKARHSPDNKTYTTFLFITFIKSFSHRTGKPCFVFIGLEAQNQVNYNADYSN